LLALEPGGLLVTKQFAFTRAFSRSLIALVAALFDEALLVKPRASAGGNSEIYLVGSGFRGLDPALGARLLARLAGYRRAPAGPCEGPPLLEPSLTRSLDSALLRAAQSLAHRQIALLEEAARAHSAFRGRLDELRRAVAPAAAAAQQAWLAENPVRRLRPEQWLPAGREGPAGSPARPPRGPPSGAPPGAGRGAPPGPSKAPPF
ncbi:MAG TPA: SAM-dependent methyltransferase, partial [Elusimicrobiota bacterium]|nr:SAM-dependent methyltransferase [Elusimicrobiota bacterium]